MIRLSSRSKEDITINASKSGNGYTNCILQLAQFNSVGEDEEEAKEEDSSEKHEVTVRLLDGKVVAVLRDADKGILVSDIKQEVAKLKGIFYGHQVVIWGEEYDLSDTRRLEGMGVEVSVAVEDVPQVGHHLAADRKQDLRAQRRWQRHRHQDR